MFTGIVQGRGVIRRARKSGLDLRLTIDLAALAGETVVVGDSVAVDGVCLTVAARKGTEVDFDVSRESLSRTLFGSRRESDTVNLELALLPTSRLGGHFVTGHVDGIGRLETIEHVGGSSVMNFSVPAELSRFIAVKGSICVDGISLTVNAVGNNSFEVNIVPHTSRETTVCEYVPGRRVHLEIDLIARYLDRLVSATRSPALSGSRSATMESDISLDEITQDFLSTRGFNAPVIDD